MRIRAQLSLLIIAGLAASLLPACHHDAGPPPPLPAEQIASEFEKGFKDAKQEVKDLAKKVLDALAAKDYPAAYQATQELSASPAATKDQQTLASRAFLTITGLLQTAQDQGDEKATTALKTYRSTK